jgi:hypothetical protein
MVPLSEIRVDLGTQCRKFGTSSEAVKDFRADVEAGEKLEEVVLFEGDDKQLIMGDGFTRYAALKMAGATAIEAKILQGSRFDAMAYNAGENAKQNAQRWTREDKDNSVRLILSDPEGASWTDHRIAVHCRVSDDKVKAVRDKLVEETGKPGPEKRKGKDNREYKAKKPRKGKAETNGAPEGPKPGDPKVDWKEFDRALGVLERFPDEIGRHYKGEKDGTEDTAARRCLDTLAKIMNGWRKHLKEIDKAEKKGK